MGAHEYHVGKVVVARLAHEDDLLQGITSMAVAHRITVGAVKAIGALREARLAYYHQDRREYAEFDVEGPVEIISCVGNVSRRDGGAATHAHLCVSSHDGSTRGGHLVSGCVVFACEVVLTELLGPPLERGFDEVTGLPLWTGL